MGRKSIDLTGQVFEHLYVVKRAGSTEYGNPIWICNCNCGNTTIVPTNNLTSGKTKSCGCYNREKRTKHGKTRTPTYRVWESMKRRCYVKKARNYYLYGGRGIIVCSEWVDSFETFLKDMGERLEGTTLDRINPNGNYEKTNCRWATNEEQSNNKRSSVTIDYLGEVNTIKYFSQKYNIPYSTLWRQLRKNMIAEETITENNNASVLPQN